MSATAAAGKGASVGRKPEGFGEVELDNTVLTSDLS